ncbi:aldehyde-activating protein [Asticcacaulis sp. BYS171W]|uniref:Aldehyde-activating protein n=1 Tax=Asticcacaulis aquaticus TaxID=2984212 RepID=A0ABT5HPD8_9CAUL|nr:aldehyde-activating protein [Asticcacaulis aquaticus]MDC7681912.1 aldehyde-activating protein [Asticcacaulis aquaticus]
MTLTATCHCGATRITLPRTPDSAHECNCSYCGRLGAVWAYFDPAEAVIESATHDRVYSASEGVNRHHFCAHCGNHTHGDSPDWSQAYHNDGTPKGEAGVVPAARTFMVNLRMVDGFDFDRLHIEKMDGKNNW